MAGGVERHAGVAQRVGDGQVAAAEQAEDGVDTERGERPADRLRDPHYGRTVRRKRSPQTTARIAARIGIDQLKLVKIGEQGGHEEDDAEHAAGEHEVVRALLALAT